MMNEQSIREQIGHALNDMGIVMFERKTLDWYIDRERKWIDQCGGNLAGYIQRYGAAGDPDKSGDGGEAIYEADLNTLKRLEALKAKGRKYL